VPSDLTQSQEGYVETIYRLESEKRVARVKEIAAIHQVSSPAVTKSLKGLAELGLVSYEPYGVVTLSDRGRAIGRELILRYRAMEDFLRTVLGVSPELAEQVSDDFEHHMPAPVLCRLVQFVAYYKDTVDQKFSWSSTCANLCGRYDSEDCVLASRA
jgi:DtxR family Mn-dependent transcriptional regulator